MEASENSGSVETKIQCSIRVAMLHLALLISQVISLKTSRTIWHAIFGAVWTKRSNALAGRQIWIAITSPSAWNVHI